jgi:tRNA G10  N-methylase Trm11
MKQVFILGRNPKLSRQEILSYLEARAINFSEVLFEDNILVLEVSLLVNIQEFGGTIRSGAVEFEGAREEFEEYIIDNEIIPSDKFSYSIFGNGDYEILQDKFKLEKKRAVLKHGRRKIRFQGGENVNLPNSDFSLFYHLSDNRVYFGIINQEYDYSELKIRDMEKPIRREHLAISPRLAKILINLSGAKTGQNLLDPFCGIGGILMEGIIKGLNVTGIDSDKQAVADARKNIEWLLSKFKINVRYTLINQNSASTPDKQFDAIATETPLGELLKKKPSDKEAQKIIEDFERKIIPVLKRFKQVKRGGGRVAITFPVVRKFKVNKERIVRECGLRVVIEPIEEFRPKQFISREILVLE